MPTYGKPIFAVRLSAKSKASLADMAKVYGAPNSSAFAREVLETMVSGDRAQVEQFLKRLLMRSGEQMALNLVASVPMEPRKPAKKGRSARKRGRRPRTA